MITNNDNSLTSLKSSSLENSLSDLNWINVGTGGTFKKTKNLYTSPDNIDGIIKHIKDNGLKKIVIHFHGGLISEARGLKSAQQFYEDFKDQTDTHPITMVWETGLIESIPEALRIILQSDNFLRELIMKVAEFIAKKLGIEIPDMKLGLVSPSIEELGIAIENFDQKLDKNELDILFKEHYKEVEDQELFEAIYSELIGSKMDIEMSSEESDRIIQDNDNSIPQQFAVNRKLIWALAKIGKRCVKRFITKRDHGIWPTIIEESFREIRIDDLGTAVWSAMKTKAEQMWLSNHNLSGDNQHVGTYMMKKLIENFPDNEIEVSVVGHSAGSVAICEWIKAIKEHAEFNSFKFKNIFF